METTRVLNDEVRQDILALMSRYPMPRSAILMALHRVQDELGWVPPEAQREVAEIFGMPPAEVESLVTFYYMYYRKPMGRYVFKVCRSISCWLRGSDDITRHLKERLGVGLGETTGDGLFSVVEGECLAACGGAPAVQINDRFFENATPESLDGLIEQLRRGEAPYPAGPEAWRPEGER